MVEILTTGRARDKILGTCAKNVWLLTVIFNIHIVVTHISGVTKTVADLWSRCHNTVKTHSKVNVLLPKHTWIYFGPATRYGAEVSVLGPDQNIALWVVMLK